MTIRIDGMEFLQRNLDRLSDKVKAQVAEAVKDGAEAIRKTAQESIASGSKSGKVYKTKRGTHQSAAPGQPPAELTGKLRRSIKIRYYKGGLAAEIGSKHPTAHLLEYGTKRIRKRPFMFPALLKERPRIERAIQKIAKNIK